MNPEHDALVRGCVKYFRGRLHPMIDRDDLYQAGMVGLFQAVGNYKAENGASFETHAKHRIWGAILDEIRRARPGTRSNKKNTKMVSVEQERALDDVASEDPWPCALVGRSKDADIARAVLDTLSDRERVVVSLRHQGWSLDEIGEVFGFNESRACQIYGAAIKNLRGVLAA